MLVSQGNRGLTAVVLIYIGQLPLAVVFLKTVQDTKILKMYLFYEKQHVGGNKDKISTPVKKMVQYKLYNYIN